MTREQTKEAIRIMQAYVDGKEVDVQRLLDGSVWMPAGAPCWDWLNGNYRIKPTAKFRSWTADEVPQGAWMRVKDSPHTGRRILICGTYDILTRSTWLSTSEHSTDGGKTWLPCGVVEESK